MSIPILYFKNIPNIEFEISPPIFNRYEFISAVCLHPEAVLLL
jgi:hypothetical protein